MQLNVQISRIVRVLRVARIYSFQIPRRLFSPRLAPPVGHWERGVCRPPGTHRSGSEARSVCAARRRALNPSTRHSASLRDALSLERRQNSPLIFLPLISQPEQWQPRLSGAKGIATCFTVNLQSFEILVVNTDEIIAGLRGRENIYQQ